MSQFTSHTQSPYSHGLEKIYSIETVDVSTVRPMSVSPLKKEKEPLISKKTDIKDALKPLTFDLGDRYRGWMEPFVLQEPIEVLGLGAQALRSLIKAGVSVVGDLVQWRDEKILPEGVGAGHYDEAMQRLAEHLDTSPLCFDRIDMISYLRCIMGKDEPSMAHLLVKPYGLEELFPLNPAQAVDLRRGDEKKLRKKAFHNLTEEHCFLAETLWKKIVDVFCKPWMEKRKGIASKEELTEFLSYRSLYSQFLQPVMNLMEECFFKKTPFQLALYQLEDELFSCDEQTKNDFIEIKKVAISYFYKNRISYRLDELISFITKESGGNWIDFSPKLVEKTLRMSSKFLVYRNLDAKPTVILHPID